MEFSSKDIDSEQGDDFEAFLVDTSDLGCLSTTDQNKSDSLQTGSKFDFLSARRQSRLIEQLTSIRKLVKFIEIQR